jgi:SAM-dependent methyltransferase
MRDAEYFNTRFAYDSRRDLVWKVLCDHYFSRLISDADCVLELGAGYGTFINNVTAARRIAVDKWSGFVTYLGSGVESRVGDVNDLSFLDTASVDFAFASNTFEHVTQEEFASVLEQLRRILKPHGTLNILQPNFYYAYREYFDDYTHRTIYTHIGLCDFLAAHGYGVMECRKRFLPLTMKSRLPISKPLIRAYLASPWKPFAKQMLIRASVRRS